MSDDSNPYAVYDTYTNPGAAQSVASALIGPPIAGWMTHVFLFGLVANQAFDYLYGPLYRTDSQRTKITFWTLIVLELASAGVCFAEGTQQQRDTNTLLLAVTPLDSIPFFFAGIIAFIVQLCLAERASKFFITRSKSIRWLFLATVIFFSSIGLIASVFLASFYALFSADPNNPIVLAPYTFNLVNSVWTFSSAIVDVVITVSLILVLKGEMKGFNLQTDDLMKQIIRLSMETGCTTSFTALLSAILAVAFPKREIWSINICLVFSYPLPPLYVLSYIVTLNARGEKLASRRGSSVSGPSGMRRGSGFTSGAQFSSVPGSLQGLPPLSGKNPNTVGQGSGGSASGVYVTREEVRKTEKDGEGEELYTRPRSVQWSRNPLSPVLNQGGEEDEIRPSFKVTFLEKSSQGKN
ncbi:hypothetical protein T439DRAFT_329443 [Meredithblackwellia eburnea MCA 4105]